MTNRRDTPTPTVLAVLAVLAVTAVTPAAVAGLDGTDGIDADPSTASAASSSDAPSAPTEPSVTFRNQTSTGTHVTVAQVSLPNGGFVVLHDRRFLSGSVLDSVVGVSAFLGAGTHEEVPVRLREPISDSETLVAVVHRDTDADRTYDFEASDGGTDGLSAVDGRVVADDASVTVERTTQTATPTEPSTTATPTARPTTTAELPVTATPTARPTTETARPPTSAPISTATPSPTTGDTPATTGFVTATVRPTATDDWTTVAPTTERSAGVGSAPGVGSESTSEGDSPAVEGAGSGATDGAAGVGSDAGSGGNGEDADSTALDEAGGGDSGNGSAAPDRDAPTDDGAMDDSTASRAPTGTADGATAESVGTPVDADRPSSEASQPGFTGPVALVALVLAVALARRTA